MCKLFCLVAFFETYCDTGNHEVHMNAIQLEFNLENRSEEEMHLYMMQKQIDEMCQSMNKVRKKLFAEVGEMKKLCDRLQKENMDLKDALKELKNEPQKTNWIYGQNGRFFDVSEPQEAIC